MGWERKESGRVGKGSREREYWEKQLELGGIWGVMRKSSAVEASWCLPGVALVNSPSNGGLQSLNHAKLPVVELGDQPSHKTFDQQPVLPVRCAGVS